MSKYKIIDSLVNKVDNLFRKIASAYLIKSHSIDYKVLFDLNMSYNNKEDILKRIDRSKDIEEIVSYACQDLAIESIKIKENKPNTRDRDFLHQGTLILIGDFYPKFYGGIKFEDENLIDRFLMVPLPNLNSNDKNLNYKTFRNSYNNFLNFMRVNCKRDGATIIDKSGQILASRIYIPLTDPDPDSIKKGRSTRHLSGQFAAKNIKEVSRAIVLSEENNDITIYRKYEDMDIDPKVIPKIGLEEFYTKLIKKEKSLEKALYNHNINN